MIVDAAAIPIGVDRELPFVWRSRRCTGVDQREPRPPSLRKSRSASVGATAAARS